MSSALPLGSTIGIMGGGQLGRMICLEARRLGYRTCVLDPDPASPAAQVADSCIVGSLSEPGPARELARRAQVLTYEFENVDLTAARAAAELAPLYPSSGVLQTTQHRIKEKMFLRRLGLPVPAFAAVRSLADVADALRSLRLPAVMKTAVGGYDGKGQAIVHTAEEAEAGFRRLAALADTLIVEEFVDIAMELSVICARGRDGQVVCYPVGENRHKDGILDVTLVPARVSPEISAQARGYAAKIVRGLEMVGLLAVEMFLARGDRLLVNELAPRPHNSGHYTLDACATSQFEQLLRAICDLPLGTTELYAPAAMVNLLGDLWLGPREPDMAQALAVPGARLYLYGKAKALPRRKMGHLCCVAASVDVALERALAARSGLQGALEAEPMPSPGVRRG
jgi:5-(carboxyamino)imidazole ribonucleotide synthase